MGPRCAAYLTFFLVLGLSTSVQGEILQSSIPPTRISKDYRGSWVEVQIEGDWVPVCSTGTFLAPDLATALCISLSSAYVKGWFGASTITLSDNSAVFYCADTDGSSPSACEWQVGHCQNGALLGTATGLQCSTDGQQPPGPPPPSPPPPAPDGFAGQSRLRGSEAKDQGVLEVMYAGEYGTVCDTGLDHAFNDAEAMAACRGMGYAAGGRRINIFQYSGTDEDPNGQYKPPPPVLAGVDCGDGSKESPPSSLLGCKWRYDTTPCRRANMIFPPVAVACYHDAIAIPKPTAAPSPSASPSATSSQQAPGPSTKPKKSPPHRRVVIKKKKPPPPRHPANGSP